MLVEPDDPLYEAQIHLRRMELPAAWDVVKGQDSTAVIAIVDSGTNWRHEDLMANVWTNPDEVPDNGVDDDENGFVDDMHGWNFNNNQPDPSGSDWHGTATASVAAGVTKQWSRHCKFQLECPVHGHQYILPEFAKPLLYGTRRLVRWNERCRRHKRQLWIGICKRSYAACHTSGDRRRCAGCSRFRQRWRKLDRKSFLSVRLSGDA